LPIIGFDFAEGGSVAALYLARREGKRLVYAGKAGTGFTVKVARELGTLLEPHEVDRPPLSVPNRKPKATWVEPVFSALIEHRGITADGLLRQASYKGLRGRPRPR
jgi:bifunctional non-homologous end joining protein LigD